MKRLVLGLFLVGIFSNIFANEIFVGYNYKNKARYITWNKFDILSAEMTIGSENGAKRISKLAIRCLDDSHWYKAEMLDNSTKHGMRTYKFKFHWVMNSRVVYVDIDENRMTCR